MRYGISIGFKNKNHIRILKDTGFDYAETQLSSLYSANEEEIAGFIASLEENNIKCEAVNVMFPGGIALTGENADFAKTSDYIETVFEKTKNIGFKIVVFGSGGARKRPEGFPEEKALEQLKEMLGRLVVPAAEKYDFTLAVEELHKGETNMINTVDEAENLAKQVNNPRIKILADLYHIGLEKYDVNKLALKSGIIHHCHIANPYNKRFYPHAKDSPEVLELYKSFFESLKNAGYNRRMSIEGALGGLADAKNISIPDWVGDEDKIFYAEAKASLEFMKELEYQIKKHEKNKN